MSCNAVSAIVNRLILLLHPGLLTVVNRNSVIVLIFLEPLCNSVRVIASVKHFSEQKTLSVVQLCEMKDILIYVYKNTVIDCV